MSQPKYQIISDIPELKYYADIDLTRYSTMKLKSRGDLVEVYSLTALQELVKRLNTFNKKYRIIGWGANTLLPEKTNVLLIKLSFKNYKVQDFDVQKEIYKLPACFPLPFLVKIAEKYGLSGFECLTGIPASVGGAVFMNAGTRLGEIGSLVTEVKYVRTNGSLGSHNVDAGSFSYRKNNFLKAGEVVYEVSICPKGIDLSVKNKIQEYRNYRSETQPLNANSCGCIFKNSNGVSAGKLIDESGLKGFTFKNLEISDVHANFILNKGESTLEDLKSFIEMIQEKVLEKKSMNIECEVRYE